MCMCVCMYVHACMHTCLNVGTCIDSHMHISNQDKLRDPIFKRVRDSDGGFLNTKRAYVISSQQKQKKKLMFCCALLFCAVRDVWPCAWSDVSRVRHGSVTRASRKRHACVTEDGFEGFRSPKTHQHAI